MENIDFSKYSIVVYDDNEIWLKTMSLWCQHYGFRDIHCFSDETKLLNYTYDNILNIDILIMDYYIGQQNTTDIIRKIRKMNSETLIIAVSADFITDDKVLDTEEMVKSISAGANRATLKDIAYIKDILSQHMKVRSLENYNQLTKDPTTLLNNINKRTERNI